jgi:acetolactate synthase regulatory subunit
MENELTQTTDAEALARIASLCTENGFGVKNIGMSGQYADYDGKVRRHFNVELTIDTPAAGA